MRRILLLPLLAALAPAQARAQASRPATVAETPAPDDRVLIQAAPAPPAPRAELEVDLSRAWRSGATTTPDALAGLPGLVIQKTGQGGGSPVLRGRTGKEVLLLMDDLRFNNSLFRRNHQYLNTVDMFALERIDVFRGPASVRHGSDAMGGTIRLIPRRRELAGRDGWNGRALGLFSGANLGWTAHLDAEAEWAGWGLAAGATRQELGHLRAGAYGDPAGAVDRHGRQDPSAYGFEAWNLSLTRDIGPRDRLDLIIQHSIQSAAPRSDRLIATEKQPAPPDLEAYYHPQIFRWYALRWTHDAPGEALEEARLSAGAAHPEEGRSRIQASRPGTRLRERDEVVTPALEGLATFRVHPQHRITLGGGIQRDRVLSRRERVDLASGAVASDPAGRFPDGAAYLGAGLFAEEAWEPAPGWLVEAGVRWSVYKAEFDLEGLTVGPLPPFGRMQKTWHDTTFALGLTVEAAPGLALYGSAARGFRAPNLDDLAVLGDFAAGNRVPNLELEPESAWNLEAGLRARSGGWKGGFSGAITFHRDLFGSVPAFELSGERYFAVDNAGRGFAWTLEAWGEGPVAGGGTAPELVLFGEAFYTWGRNVTEDQPMARIPPPQGRLGWRLTGPEETWTAELFAAGALPQDRLAGSDADDPRVPLGGTPGWWTLGLRASAALGAGVRLAAGAENLLDRRYRVHGSGIDAPGLNLFAGMELAF